MKIYVVTNVENGWDCVVGVFKTREKAIDYLREGDDEEIAKLTDQQWLDDTSYIIHEERLQ